MKELLLVLVSLFCFDISVQPATACNGLERWSVKTLQDADVGSINSTPKPAVIDDLITIQQQYHEKVPRHGVELQVYRVACKIEGYKTEPDGDFHIVIADPKSGKTMFAEIPDPNCPDVATSPSVQRFQNARKQFSKFATKKKTIDKKLYKVTPGFYTITGVGFIDKNHGPKGQIGHANNQIEIHPVLSIEPAP
jgi:hypothetical protein